MSSLLFVPLDDRPCTRDFPCQLAPLVGWTLRKPPDALLGTYTEPGDPPALLEWVKSQEADGAILSVDMLLFGGLVASRALHVDENTTRERLAELRDVLSRLQRPVDVFDILMRVPPFCTSDSERRFSDRLLAYSKMAVRPRLGPITKLRMRALRRGIPHDFLARYESTRRRNHDVNREVLTWAREGRVDFALIGMDDSKTEGFNVAERKTLEPLLTSGRSDLLPGADEVAMLLLARRALIAARKAPTVSVHYSPYGFGERVTRYEDRPVHALLQAHMRVLGIRLVDAGGDIDLFVNGSGRAQQEAATQILSGPRARHRRFSQEIKTAIDRDRLAAIADLGFANGGDRGFLSALADAVDLTKIGAFAAWNTAGNTVGTVLAHAVLRWLQLQTAERDDGPHLRFLLERFLDDTLYQSVVRNEIGLRLALERANIYALGERHQPVQAQVADRMQAAASEFYDRNFRNRIVGNRRIEGPLRLTARLPWPRIFEIELGADFDLVAT